MKSTNNGFTLVELVVSIAILALIIVAISGVMFSNNLIFKKTKSDINVQEIALDSYNKMSSDVMQAKNIYIEGYSTDGKLTFYKTSNSSKKVITSDPADKNSGITLTNGSKYMRTSDIYFNDFVPANSAKDKYEAKIESISKGEDKPVDATKLSEYNTIYNTVRYMTAEERDAYADYLKKIGADKAGCTSYDSLKVKDGSKGHTYEYTNVYVKKMTIQYTLPVNPNYEPTPSGNKTDVCYITYEFDKNTLTVSTSYKYMTELNDSSVYTDTLNYLTIDSSTGETVTACLAKIDSDNNSIEFEMEFEKQSMTYKSGGIATIRNSYVLHDAN